MSLFCCHPAACMSLLMHIWHSLLIFFIFLKLISCLLIFICFLLNTFVRVCANVCSFQFNNLCPFLCLSLTFYFRIFSIHLSLLYSFLPVLSVSFLILFPTFPSCSRKVTRSESARVDRHSSRRHGSSRAKQSRSRSDVDLQPPATTPTTALFNPQLLHP